MGELHCETIRYPSSDGVHTMQGLLYTVPGVTPRAVLQLSHGMCEYVARYEPLAHFFAEHGFAVAGNDHQGHGGTGPKAEYGRFAPKNGRFYVLRDLKKMNSILHERYPGLPVILYGHSMGSFFARWYAEVYGDTIAALVLSGTAGPNVQNAFGRVLAKTLRALHGPEYISPLMLRLNFGTYCKRIENPASPNAWLTRDEKAVAAYDADEKCVFSFAAGTYYEMLTVLEHVSSKKWAAAIRRDLPVLLIAGAQDPVGDYGAGVCRVAEMLRAAGVSDVTCHIDPDGRHELHNEKNRQEIFDLVLAWLTGHGFAKKTD